MSSLTDKRSPKPTVMKPGKRERLCQELRKFFAQRLAVSGDTEVTVVDDLILLRCKDAVSPAEANLGTMKAGRLLLREVSDRLCQDLQPELTKLLRQLTGLRLHDVCVGTFLRRRERIYLLTMSDTVKQKAQ